MKSPTSSNSFILKRNKKIYLQTSSFKICKFFVLNIKTMNIILVNIIAKTSLLLCDEGLHHGSSFFSNESYSGITKVCLSTCPSEIKLEKSHENHSVYWSLRYLDLTDLYISQITWPLRSLYLSDFFIYQISLSIRYLDLKIRVFCSFRLYHQLSTMSLHFPEHLIFKIYQKSQI